MPVKLLTISTATGIFGPVDFDGNLHRFAAYADGSTAADRDIGGTVEGTVGGSPKWTTVITLTTNSSGARFNSTGDVAFDKLRVNVSANNATASFPAWLHAGD